MQKKILFIDASVYINCALQEANDSNCEVLENILKKIEKEELTLVLPEITKNEVLVRLKPKFNELKESLLSLLKPLNDESKILENKLKAKKTNEKTSKLKLDTINKIIKKSESNIDDAIKSEYNKSFEIINKIFNSKNIYNISLSDSLILKGIKRSLLKRPPFRDSGGKTHTKDQDCIAFECQLFQLSEEKTLQNQKYIICVDDSDYLDKKKKIYPEILEDIKPFCKEIVGYNNPLEMLNEEFKAKYSKEDIEGYDIYKTDKGGILSTVMLSDLKNSQITIDQPFVIDSGYNAPTTTMAIPARPTYFNILPSDFDSIYLNGRYCTVCEDAYEGSEKFCSKCGTLLQHIHLE